MFTISKKVSMFCYIEPRTFGVYFVCFVITLCTIFTYRGNRITGKPTTVKNRKLIGLHNVFYSTLSLTISRIAKHICFTKLSSNSSVPPNRLSIVNESSVSLNKYTLSQIQGKYQKTFS